MSLNKSLLSNKVPGLLAHINLEKRSQMSNKRSLSNKIKGLLVLTNLVKQIQIIHNKSLYNKIWGLLVATNSENQRKISQSNQIYRIEKDRSELTNLEKQKYYPKRKPLMCLAVFRSLKRLQILHPKKALLRGSNSVKQILSAKNLSSIRSHLPPKEKTQKPRDRVHKASIILLWKDLAPNLRNWLHYHHLISFPLPKSKSNLILSTPPARYRSKSSLSRIT